MASDKTNTANWAIARARWEGEPRCSYADLADFLGISKQAIGKRAIKDGWTKKVNMTHIAGRAHAVADHKISNEAEQTSNHTDPVDDQSSPAGAMSPGSLAAAVISQSIPDSKSATPEMLAQAVEDAAVDARAQILKRHRTEWVSLRLTSVSSQTGKR